MLPPLTISLPKNFADEVTSQHLVSPENVSVATPALYVHSLPERLSIHPDTDSFPLQFPTLPTIAFHYADWACG